jgi:hypothetical protein
VQRGPTVSAIVITLALVMAGAVTFGIYHAVTKPLGVYNINPLVSGDQQAIQNVNEAFSIVSREGAKSDGPEGAVAFEPQATILHDLQSSRVPGVSYHLGTVTRPGEVSVHVCTNGRQLVLAGFSSTGSCFYAVQNLSGFAGPGALSGSMPTIPGQQYAVTPPGSPCSSGTGTSGPPGSLDWELGWPDL